MSHSSLLCLPFSLLHIALLCLLLSFLYKIFAHKKGKVLHVTSLDHVGGVGVGGGLYQELTGKMAKRLTDWQQQQQQRHSRPKAVTLLMVLS